MRPYTEKFLDASQESMDKSSDDVTPSSGSNKDLYMLKGVIIHQGDVKHGHYFSYIRPDMDSSGTAGTDWFEFNDHRVKPFQTGDLAAACFGGCRPGRKTETSSNAYLLLYERVDAQTLSTPVSPPQIPNKASVLADDQAEGPGRLVSGRVRYGAEVQALNISTARRSMLFDPHLFQFFENCLLQITEQCCSTASTASAQSVSACYRMLLDFYLEVVLRIDKAQRPNSDVKSLTLELTRYLQERHRQLEEHADDRWERAASSVVNWVIDTLEDLKYT